MVGLGTVDVTRTWANGADKKNHREEKNSSEWMRRSAEGDVRKTRRNDRNKQY